MNKDDKFIRLVESTLDAPSSPMTGELLSENESLFEDYEDYDPTFEPGNVSVDSDSNISDCMMQIDDTANVSAGNSLNCSIIDSVDSIDDIDDEDVEEGEEIEVEWVPLDENNILNDIPFNPNNDFIGVNPDIIETMYDCPPYEYWRLFVTDEIIDIIVLETNRYAAQQMAGRTNISANARIKKWDDTK